MKSVVNFFQGIKILVGIHFLIKCEVLYFKP